MTYLILATVPIFPEPKTGSTPEDTSWYNLQRNKYDQYQTNLEDIEETIHNGLDFLAESQQSDGLWSDFTTRSSGISTEWVTGYVLAGIPELVAQSKNIEIEDACMNLLSTQRRNGGWGYSDNIPPDADSTAVVTRGLIQHKNSIEKHEVNISSKIDESREFLLRCQSDNGGFRTYHSSSALREYRIERDDIDFSGWCKPRASVTAAALMTLYDSGMNAYSTEIEKGLNFLYKSHQENCLWKPYWWCGPTYPTSVSVEAINYFTETKDEVLTDAGQKILNKASRGRWSLLKGDAPSPFATALNLRTILICNTVDDLIFESVRWLIDNQLNDGSWQSVPMMQIPPPNIVDAETVHNWRVNGKGVGSRSADQNRIFTTSTVLRTLFDLAWYVGL